MTARGKPGKPKAGFPPFPPSLESPQKQRAFHIPTAPTTGPYLTKTKHGRPYGRAENRQLGGVGQNKLPKWAKITCQSHMKRPAGRPEWIQRQIAETRSKHDRLSALANQPTGPEEPQVERAWARIDGSVATSVQTG